MLLGLVLQGMMSLVPLPMAVSSGRRRTWHSHQSIFFCSTPFTVFGCNYFFC